MNDFRTLHDPDNPENRNAGNGGDLVKHTVYLALAAFLGPGLSLRECHAGRGVYRIPAGDPRQRRIERLLASDCELSRVQREIAARLGLARGAWYAGSALLLAHGAAPSRHEAYEWDPRTRAILAGAAEAGGYSLFIPAAGSAASFDGEGHIAAQIATWGGRDLVLLDPFGLWRHDKHAFRRARYSRILEGRAALSEPPALAIFFTWGGDARGEAADLEGEPTRAVVRWGDEPALVADDEARAQTPRGGYADLRRGLAGPIVRVRWRCDLRCVMWLAVPDVAGLHRCLAGVLDVLHREVIDDAFLEIAIC